MANVSLIAQIADQTTSKAAGVVAEVVPSGAIMTYAGSAAPTGWLLCDGAAVSRTTFSSLFESIQTSFGVGDGSTTFNLPDLRGRFVRYDDNMGNHGIPGVTAEGAAGRDSARAHGSAQAQTTAANGLGGTAAAQGWTYTANSGSAAAQGWTYTANSGSAAAQGWTYTANSGSAAAQGWTYTANSGSAAGQTQGATTTALSSGALGASTTNIGHTHGSSTASGTTGNDVHDYGHPAVGDGAGTNTATPDYLASAGERDKFSNRQHNHSVSITAGGQSLGTTNVSLSAGSVTGTTNIQHTHGASTVSSVTGTNSSSIVSSVTGTNSSSIVSSVTGTNSSSIVSSVTGTNSSSSLAVTGASETRPINIALNAIIKV